MKYRRRIYCSSSQRAEIWDRWQRGESMRSIGRVFDRQSSSVFSVTYRQQEAFALRIAINRWVF
jgi:hypothetical protein